MHKYKSYSLILLLFFSVIFATCSVSPEPINYGKDECEHCRMMITDNKYGTEMITDKGKVFKFDSIECLLKSALQKNLVGDDQHSFLVTNFSVPEQLIDAKTAFYIHNDNFRSPMGLNVSSFSNDSDVQKFLSDNGGQKISWLDVIEMVKQSGM